MISFSKEEERMIIRRTKDFNEGVRDCILGKEHGQFMSKEYTAGFGFQYELEQKATNRTEKQFQGA